MTEAVNLGGDSDTTACVAGALAAALYGYDSIPRAMAEPAPRERGYRAVPILMAGEATIIRGS